MFIDFFTKVLYWTLSWSSPTPSSSSCDLQFYVTLHSTPVSSMWLLPWYRTKLACVTPTACYMSSPPHRLRILESLVLIYLLTAVGLPPGGSSTVHIYTQTIHRTTQNKQYIEQHNNLGECGPCHALASYTLAFALQLRKKHGKPSVL